MSEESCQHDLVSWIKDLAIELGRTPTRDEFGKSGAGRSGTRIDKYFGSYTTLVQAAGLEPNSYRTPKLTNAVFKKSLEKHLDKYEPRDPVGTPKTVEPYKRTLFIPDIHFPFAHQKTLEKIYRFADDEKPEIIVQVGDLYDAYSHSKFPRSHNIFTPREEQKLAREQATAFWSELTRVSPTSRKVQMIGNHDVRPLKRILEVYPEAEDWIEKILREMLSFPGVETVYDHREELMLPGDVMVLHGYRSKLGDHRDHALYNAVVGHQHVGGCVFRHIRGRTLWELNCGLAGDPEAKGLTYSAQKISNWTLGWGFLDDRGPRFICA